MRYASNVRHLFAPFRIQQYIESEQVFNG